MKGCAGEMGGGEGGGGRGGSTSWGGGRGNMCLCVYVHVSVWSECVWIMLYSIRGGLLLMFKQEDATIVL